MEEIKEKEPQTQLELSEDELPIVDILHKMKKGKFRRKKASKRTEELPQTKTLPQGGKPKSKRRRSQGLETIGLRRSTRLNTMQQEVSEAMEYIDLEENEPT